MEEMINIFPTDTNGSPGIPMGHLFHYSVQCKRLIITDLVSRHATQPMTVASTVHIDKAASTQALATNTIASEQKTGHTIYYFQTLHGVVRVVVPGLK